MIEILTILLISLTAGGAAVWLILKEQDKRPKPGTEAIFRYKDSRNSNWIEVKVNVIDVNYECRAAAVEIGTVEAGRMVVKVMCVDLSSLKKIVKEFDSY